MIEPDSYFPKIDCEPIDVYVMKNSVLAAFPNAIILGHPLVIHNKLVFDENAYIKIQPTYYKDWKTSINAIGTKIGLIDYQKVNREIIVQYLTYEITWKCENELFYIEIIGHKDNKTKIVVDVAEFYKIINGFCELFFKPLCLPAFVHYAFKVCSQTQSLSQIKEIKNIQSALVMVKKLDLGENDFHNLFIVAENILRFHSQLILYKEFLKKNF